MVLVTMSSESAKAEKALFEKFELLEREGRWDSVRLLELALDE